MLNPASWLRKLLALTSCEVRHRLPRATMEPLDLLRYAATAETPSILQVGA